MHFLLFLSLFLHLLIGDQEEISAIFYPSAGFAKLQAEEVYSELMRLGTERRDQNITISWPFAIRTIFILVQLHNYTLQSVGR